MSLSSSTLELLVSRGLDPAAIVEVTKAIERDFVSPRSAANRRAYEKIKALKSATDSVAEISPTVPPREKSTPSENELEKRATPRSELEPTVGAEMAAEIVEHRRGKKSPLTVGGAKRLAVQLAKTADPAASAAFMIDKGWTGFKPEWMANASRAGPAPPSSAQSHNHGGFQNGFDRSASAAARARLERLRATRAANAEPQLLT